MPTIRGRKVRACGRKQRRVVGASVATAGNPWSGTPPLIFPIFVEILVSCQTPSIFSHTLVIQNDPANYAPTRMSWLLTNPLAADTDGDGFWDGYNVTIGTKTYIGEMEPWLRTSPTKKDTDSDMLSDWDEVMVWHTDPLCDADSDGDGLYDGPNVPWGYTLNKKNHRGEDFNVDVPKDGTYTGNPYTIGGDTNGNGILNTGEQWIECNPLNPDTDGDSANDGQA